MSSAHADALLRDLGPVVLHPLGAEEGVAGEAPVDRDVEPGARQHTALPRPVAQVVRPARRRHVEEPGAVVADGARGLAPAHADLAHVGPAADHVGADVALGRADAGLRRSARRRDGDGGEAEDHRHRGQDLERPPAHVGLGQGSQLLLGFSGWTDQTGCYRKK